MSHPRKKTKTKFRRPVFNVLESRIALSADLGISLYPELDASHFHGSEIVPIEYVALDSGVNFVSANATFAQPASYESGFFESEYGYPIFSWADTLELDRFIATEFHSLISNQTFAGSAHEPNVSFVLDPFEEFPIDLEPDLTPWFEDPFLSLGHEHVDDPIFEFPTAIFANDNLSQVNFDQEAISDTVISAEPIFESQTEDPLVDTPRQVSDQFQSQLPIQSQINVNSTEDRLFVAEDTTPANDSAQKIANGFVDNVTHRFEFQTLESENQTDFRAVPASLNSINSNEESGIPFDTGSSKDAELGNDLIAQPNRVTGQVTRAITTEVPSNAGPIESPESIEWMTPTVRNLGEQLWSDFRAESSESELSSPVDPLWLSPSVEIATKAVEIQTDFVGPAELHLGFSTSTFSAHSKGLIAQFTPMNPLNDLNHFNIFHAVTVTPSDSNLDTTMDPEVAANSNARWWAIALTGCAASLGIYTFRHRHLAKTRSRSLLNSQPTRTCNSSHFYLADAPTVQATYQWIR
ncbi:MAG: hypothetical protein AAF623_14905 [Planctomycetota bacterium]